MPKYKYLYYCADHIPDLGGGDFVLAAKQRPKACEICKTRTRYLYRVPMVQALTVEYQHEASPEGAARYDAAMDIITDLIIKDYESEQDPEKGGRV